MGNKLKKMADAQRLYEVQREILAALRDLVDHADETVWLTPAETVFERLAFLYEYAGGDRQTLAVEWPEYF